MWRPKGWKDIHEKEIKYDIKVGRLSGLTGNTLIDTFEAGADAMLKEIVGELRSRGVITDNVVVVEFTHKEWKSLLGEVKRNSV